ncbi:thioredoxin H-type-like [Cucurbita pepo subsp. pepo]|uniref:thioredoxin H-type-like n=1 Tax=Cucurbita pepo subsp. pepo TaxID=3664 RepID=UPI000C9D6E5C|nr:thioredoxin H-type-like [Cucurbita pepo subsp. pepo]
MAEEGQVIACHKKAEWDAHLAKAKESGKLIVVDFTASWCGPCRAIAPYFSELAKNHPGVVFLKVDVDELNTVATEWEINAMPTFVFMKRGETVHKIVGADKSALLKKIEELKTPTAATTSTA